MAESWNQSVFDSDVKKWLDTHDVKTWPRFLNKRVFFVAKGAIPETPKVSPEQIEADISKLVYSRQGGGPARQVTLGYALASKIASQGFDRSKRFQRAITRQAFGKGTAEMEKAAWEAEVAAKLGRLKGSRKAAAGFLRLGWAYVMKLLGPHTGLSFWPTMPLVGARMRGMDKGRINPATSSKSVASIENIAHSRTETRGGFMRIGEPALDRAMQKEAGELARHMEEELEPHVKEFNRRQR